MKYLQSYRVFEAKTQKYSQKDRIILLGAPTIGKSTISKELGEKLGLEVISLDRLQPDFGYGDENEIKWYSRMRGYAFLPTSDCNDEIKDFIKDLMKKRKEKE